jgi:hypothetical protein
VRQDHVHVWQLPPRWCVCYTAAVLHGLPLHIVWLQVCAGERYAAHMLKVCVLLVLLLPAAGLCWRMICGSSG